MLLCARNEIGMDLDAENTISHKSSPDYHLAPMISSSSALLSGRRWLSIMAGECR
jgi:hypothetical protein